MDIWQNSASSQPRLRYSRRRDVGALGSGHLREGEFEVAQADAAEASEASHRRSPAMTDSGGACQAARKNAKAVDEEPRKDEFKYLAERGPGDGSSGDWASRVKITVYRLRLDIDETPAVWDWLSLYRREPAAMDYDAEKPPVEAAPAGGLFP